MAGQSFAMGEAFGKGFQYGKRRISSMTNEKFNSMSANDHFDETTADITAMIPTMSKGMEKFHTLQTDIILKMIDYISKLPAEVLPDILNAPGNLVPQEHKIDYGALFASIVPKGGFSVTPKIVPVAAAPSPQLTTEQWMTLLEAQKGIPTAISEVDKALAAQEKHKGSKIDSPPRAPLGKGTLEDVARILRLQTSGQKDTRTEGQKSIQAHQASLKPIIKPRAPSSVRLQVRKLEQEIIATQNLHLRTTSRRKTNPAANAANKKRKNQLQGQINTLKRKYTF